MLPRMSHTRVQTVMAMTVPRPVALLLLVLVALAACGRLPTPATSWQAMLPWGSGVSAHVLASGRDMGPLAITVTDQRIVLADSFGHRLLVWRRSAGYWIGPEVIAVPSDIPPLTAIAVMRGGAIAAMDAGDGIWMLNRGQTIPRGSLARPDELVSASAVVPYGPGALIDALRVSATSTARILYLLPRAGAPILVLRRAIGTPRQSATPAGPAWLALPPGIGAAAAAASGGGAWLVGRNAQGQASLWHLSIGGTADHSRRLPTCQRCDLVGVTGGQVVLAMGTGTSDGRVVGITRSGTVRWRLPLPAGGGPSLGAYATMAPDGALVTLQSSKDGVLLRWYPPGGAPRAAGVVPKAA